MLRHHARRPRRRAERGEEGSEEAKPGAEAVVARNGHAVQDREGKGCALAGTTTSSPTTTRLPTTSLTTCSSNCLNGDSELVGSVAAYDEAAPMRTHQVLDVLSVCQS